MELHLIAAILFALAALGGIAMAAIHFRSAGASHPPIPLALAHGALGAIALVLLILWLVQSGAGWGSLAGIAAVVFVVAALGGIFLFARHLGKARLPSPVVVVHGLAAVTGFVLLVVFLLGGQPDMAGGPASADETMEADEPAE